MRRSDSLSRGAGPVRTGRLASKSAGRVEADRGWAALRLAVFDRDRGECVALCSPRCTGRAEHAHHMLRRSQGGRDEADNLVSLCSGCHDFVHANPAWAYEAGFLRRST